MDYLYFLQQLRDSAPAWLNETILFISEFVGGTYGLILMCLIYWCVSKRAGTLLLMSFSFSQVVNNIIKYSLRVERPFNRDARLTPYVPTTGYSFPSGHTMMAASFYGGVAFWQRKRKWLAGFCIFMMLLTAFTRNWLGAHTLQDVLVGVVLSCALVAFNVWLLNMVDKHPGRDVWVLAAALILCVVFAIVFPGGLSAAGMYGGVMLGWFIERRFVRFEIRGGLLFRAAAFLPGVALVGLIYKLLLPMLFAPLGSSMVKTLTYFFTFLLVTAGWPAVIRLLSDRFAPKTNGK